MTLSAFIGAAIFGAVLFGVGVLVGFLLGDRPDLSPPPRPMPLHPRPIIATDQKVDPRHQDPAI